MKRDYELIRRILLEIENKEDFNRLKSLEIEGYDQENVVYHSDLLKQAGLINATIYYGDGWVMVDSLTWEGHEFLDQVRNEKVWKKTIAFIKDKGGTIPFDVLGEVLKKFTLQHFE